MEARIKWVGERAFIGESGRGHSLVLGRSTGPDGRSLCPSPMELVLIGMGGCMAFDVVHILAKSREPVDDCVAELEAERADEEPRVFTRIRFVVTGWGLGRSKVERAIRLSAEKYCSASAMIGKTADITHELEVIDSARAADPTPA